ncbi:MAG: TonB-dependent receptor plug domain-containing protein [Chloroflexota bacterium]
MKNSLQACILALLIALLNGSAAYSETAVSDDLFEKSIEELLETKISSAAKYDQTTTEAAASVSIVTSEDIRRYGYKNLRDMLQSQRSFYATYDRNYVYMGLRGFSRPGSYNNQMVVMINGHLTNEKVFGSPFFGYDFALNPDAIERIEIVRGPGSTLYGNSATFAVVNVITKRGKELDGVNIMASGGSLGLRKYGITAGKEFDNELSVSASALYGEIQGGNLYFKEYDSPEHNNGVSVGMDWERFWGAQAAAEYKGLAAQALISTRYKAVPTAAWETQFNVKPLDMCDSRAYAELKYDFSPLENVQLSFKGSYDLYFFGGKYPYDDPLELLPTRMQHDSSTAKNYSLEAQMVWDVSSQNRLTFGVETQQALTASYELWWDGQSEDLPSISVSRPNKVYSIYAQDQHQALEDLSVTLGLRYDDYSLINFKNVSARAALVYNAWDDGALKLLYNNAFRIPNIYELFYTDLDGAMPNPDLKPEIIHVLELLGEYKFNENLWGTASIYGYRYNDLIDQLEYSDTTMEGNEEVISSYTQFRNISHLQAAGLEFELKATPMKGMSAYGSFCAQYATNGETEEIISNSPTHIVKLGASQTFSDILRMSGEFYFETGREAPPRSFDPENPTFLTKSKTDPAFLGNLYFALASENGGDMFHKIFQTLNLTLRIDNIFNAEYYHPGNFEHVPIQNIRQDGRTFEFEAIVKI